MFGLELPCMIADLGNDRAVPTMVTSIDLATEHPLLSVAVAKHQFLRLSLFLFGDRIHVVGGASTPCFT